MPSRSIIDPSQRLLAVICSGVVTGEEYQRHTGLLRTLPGFDPSYALFFDVRAVTDVAVKSAEMQGLTTVRLLNAEARRAIVAPDGFVFGMARMYELSFGPNENRRVFTDVAAAEAWLGINYAECLKRPVAVELPEPGRGR